MNSNNQMIQKGKIIWLYAGLAYSKLSNPVLLIIRSYPLF